MTKPICSIIIPSYNCRDYLPIALASVAIQDAGPLEILILDDGSDDGTWEYLQHAKAQYPGLVSVRAARLGPSEGRNLLISLAKSDLCAFLDADDIWWPNKLKEQIAFHQANPDVVLSFTDYIHFDPSGQTHGTAFEFWKPAFLTENRRGYVRIETPLAALLGTNPVGTSTVMARTKALQNAKGFAKSMPSAEDWDLWLRLAETGPVAYSRAVTMSYLQRAGSLTANREARLEAIRRILARYDGQEGAGIRAALSQAWSRYQVAFAEHHRADGNYLKAGLSHLAAFWRFPTKRVARALLADVYSALKQPLRPQKQS